MRVNGETMKLNTARTLQEFLVEQGYDPRRIAVELDGKIIPHKEFALTGLHDEAVIELVCFVGGG